MSRRSKAVRGAQLGAAYGVGLSRARGGSIHETVFRTAVASTIGAGIGASIDHRGGEKMAKGKAGAFKSGAKQTAGKVKAKGIGGKTKAQGATKKVPKLVAGQAKKFGGGVKKGAKSAMKKGSSPLDGRKRGKK